MKWKITILLLIGFLFSQQLIIGPDDAEPSSSALLEIISHDKGILLPRMNSSQRDDISDPAESLIIFNIESQCIEVFSGGQWNTIWCDDDCLGSEPADSITGNTAICVGESTALDAYGGSLGTWAFWRWYEGECGGTLIGKGPRIVVTPDETTTYFVRAEGDCSMTECTSVEVTVYQGLPDQPVAGEHDFQQFNITWNWAESLTAKAYKYNKNPSYATATDIGNALSLEQTILECDTYYQIYLWAYNDCGISQHVLLTGSTATCPMPVVVTSPVIDITQKTAISGGNVIDDGMDPQVVRGVCWSINENPDIADNFTIDGFGLGSYTSTITQLNAGQIYYVRAYATSKYGTAYGDQVTFSTLPPSMPEVSTAAISNTGSMSAVSGGNVIDDGGESSVTRGVCWNTTGNPTISDASTIDGTGPGTFVSTLTDLYPNTRYYVRSYATNSAGTAYGNQLSFTTGSLQIGDPWQGGIVAYILQPGHPGYISGETHGLIAAPGDISYQTSWGCSNEIPGSSTALGTGLTNTFLIVTFCNPNDWPNIAARICWDLELNGFTDWYLPSKDELNKLYVNRVAIGGFSNGAYWSSSADNSDQEGAWAQNFDHGAQITHWRWGTAWVRPVRSF